MSEPERDYREGVDALQSDMARHQREHVGEVTATANQRLAVETIERLEREHADQQPTAPVAAPPVETHHVQKKQIGGREYTLDKAPDKPLYRTATEFEHQVLRHAEPRIALLMTKRDEGPFGTPSWHTKTLAALYFKIKSLEAIESDKTDEADVYERVFQQDLYDLLESSNAIFGDWRKDSPVKLTVSG